MRTASWLFTRKPRLSRLAPVPHNETPVLPPGGYSPPPLMSPKQPSRLWRWTKRLLKLTFLGIIVAVAVAAGSYAWFSRDLPSVEELRTWRPPQVTKVACRDGSVCAEFYLQRRTWVDVTKLPKHVRESFLAAEDADFYSHNGLDYAGILRSAVKNLKPGGMKSGASTISQQACRALLLTQERTLARKMREWILTPRMEKALGKDQVLNLYVNTIYFGHNRYGIEEASLFYFGKHAAKLTLGEAAVLAGTVQLPHRINPVTNIVKAKRRQRYVLGQLARHGFVPQATIDGEMDKPIVLGPRPPAQVGASYAEEVRKQLVGRYGEKSVLEGGLRVQIAMEPALQAAAESSVRAGLEAVDRRLGYRGPIGQVESARFTALRPFLEKRLTEAGKRRPDERFVADLTVLKELKPPEREEGADPLADPEENLEVDEPVVSEDEKLARAIGVRTLTDGVESVGYVTAIDDAKGTAQIDLIGATGQLDFATMKWARRREGTKVSANPVKMSDVVKAGELVRVRLGVALPASQLIAATIAQLPVVQGGLVAIDPKDRSVVALVGGYDFNTSAFNRATQARRQPGSSFKPFLYATALESTRFTPTSIINDAPEAIRDPYTGKMWKPQNYEKGGFEGPITLRTALTKSKNTVSVRLIEALGPDAVIAFANKAGIKSTLPQNLTLALGTGEVSMLEIANAYTTLQTNGMLAEPVMLVRVADATGKVLEERHAAPEQVINPAVAFLATSLMRSVVEEGTAVAVLELNRPAAGKTGTAQEFRDAWFSGYTADYVASAWVGFDDHEPIGPGETGGKAALPLWLGFMRVAHQGLPPREFVVPEGVKQVRIDPRTGKLAGGSVPGRSEWFLEGTEPTEETRAVDPNDFLLHDQKRGP
ncbi:MAG: PBP1A family penicillin-binding protein [Archangium sp.]|nr:PBP1A family penicillin-binding protein [Archangium sp.]MDP3573094.1 PBP1A family penicillin-binding protein [Archangium sp.]